MTRRKRDEYSEFGGEFSRFLRALVYALFIAALIFMVFMVLALFRISSYTFKTYDSYDSVPYNRVGLLLGTSPNTAPGVPNDFFTHRIMAAVQLYQRGKIDYILVSGDNRHLSYNEPRMMMNALLRQGVPLNRIVPDFAGFNTLDSIIRARQVFMLNRVTVISQDFHNERALFIADHHGLEAIGFNAASPASKMANFRVEVREFFARIKCIFEIYFLNTGATFLGDPIPIGSNPMPKEASNKPKTATSRPKLPGNSAYSLQLNPDNAKEPSDAAIILRQEELARVKAQEVLERAELEQRGQLHHPEENAGNGVPAEAAVPAVEQMRRSNSAGRSRSQRARSEPPRHLYGDPWE